MADQMTPRVVRTVEELEVTAPATRLELKTGELCRARDYQTVMSPSSLSPVIVEAWARNNLPATILAPLSVTSEQVADAVERLFYLDPPDFDPYSGRESFRAGYLAALAAMGIPVVES